MGMMPFVMCYYEILYEMGYFIYAFSPAKKVLYTPGYPELLKGSESPL